MNNDIIEALKKVPNDMESYADISRLVDDGKYEEAISKLSSSRITASTKEQLIKALESNETYVIESTFAELNSRIAQAMCWNCWRE